MEAEGGPAAHCLRPPSDCPLGGFSATEGAVNTIAHELNHLRESMRTGTFPVSEDPAMAAGNMAEGNVVP